MNTCQRLAVNITVSISMTVLKAFSERPEMGARKLPAAPHMTKSILPENLDRLGHGILQRFRIPDINLCGDAGLSGGLYEFLGGLGKTVESGGSLLSALRKKCSCTLTFAQR